MEEMDATEETGATEPTVVMEPNQPAHNPGKQNPSNAVPKRDSVIASAWPCAAAIALPRPA